MKNISKLLLCGLCASLMVFTTGCIDETEPTNGATEKQVAGSEALLWAMTAYANNHATLSSDYHFDYGYPSIMHIRDIMTEEIHRISGDYNWYSSWETNSTMGNSYPYAQFVWNYYYKYILTANNMLTSMADKMETATQRQLSYVGISHAFRAFLYLDLARMYEFLENDQTNPKNSSGNNVLNLTVPIVDEFLTEEQSRNNPRATRDEMYNFILNDLNEAEKYINLSGRLAKAMPDLSVVYGLKARLYMWVEKYPEAAEYARKAIDNSKCVPVTADEWNNPATGFNTLSSTAWMWGSQLSSNDRVVTTGIVNWVSWMSNEVPWGYANAGPMTKVDKRFYDRISNDDFRKLAWKAPKGHPLEGQMKYNITDPKKIEDFPIYASLKFRPAEGNITSYIKGNVVAYPLMRVEEMYFIEAEATAQTNVTDGIDLLNKFMQQYRYASYTCPVSAKKDVIEEIVFQKRVELWGEGHSFYDIKRLDMSVTRGYTGTNHSEGYRFNTDGRPAWMNFVIHYTEENGNAGVKDWNNPDPSGVYKEWF